MAVEDIEGNLALTFDRNIPRVLTPVWVGDRVRVMVVGSTPGAPYAKFVEKNSWVIIGFSEKFPV